MSGFFDYFYQNARGAHQSSNSLRGFIQELEHFTSPLVNSSDISVVAFNQTSNALITSMTVGRASNNFAQAERHMNSAATYASMRSSVPSMQFQNPAVGRFHIVTSKDNLYGSDQSNLAHKKSIRALHAFNSYMGVMAMGNPEMLNTLADGKLRNKTDFQFASQFLAQSPDRSTDFADRSMLHMSQFMGLHDLYGRPQGGEFSGIQNNPQSWQDSNLRRRMGPSANNLIEALGPAGTNADPEMHRTIMDSLMRTKHSADTLYQGLQDFDDSYINRQQLNPSTIGLEGIDLDNRYGVPQSSLINDEDVMSSLEETRSGTMASQLASIHGYDVTSHNMDRDTGEISNERVHSSLGSIRTSDAVNRPEASELSSSTSNQPDMGNLTAEETWNDRINRNNVEGGSQFIETSMDDAIRDFAESLDPDTPISRDNVESLSDSQTDIFDSSPSPFTEDGAYNITFDDFDEASRREYDERLLHGQPADEVNTNNVHELSQRDFESIEKRFPIGGSEHSMSVDNIAATRGTLDAVNKLREIQNSFGRTSDADRKFYNNVGKGYLSENNFDFKVMALDDPNISPEMKKRAMLGGAIIGTSSEGGQLWMLDNPVTAAYNIASGLAGNQPSSFNRPHFGRRNISESLHRTPTPDMDPNPDNWRLTNTNLSMNDAMGNGYIVPIKGRDAIFLPSYTNPDFTFGIEIESSRTESMRQLHNNIRRDYGYDIDKMGFNGDYETVRDPSIYGGGLEYISPIMSGTRAFKAGYLMGEGLKAMGDVPAVHRGPNRWDPSGVHVNMGSIPENHRKDGFKFTTDYMRLNEDLVKRMTSPDRRYKAWTGPVDTYGGGFSPYNLTVQPERLNRQARQSPATEHGRQMWSQSISRFRPAGNSGMNEYDFYRNKGKHYYPVSMHMDDHPGKLAKYKSIGMHKLQLAGVMEYRAPMHIPGGDHVLASMAISSKLAGDIYQGAMRSGAFAHTGVLIPPTSSNFGGNRNAFAQVVNDFLGIKNPKSQQFLWEMQQKCSQDGGRFEG